MTNQTNQNVSQGIVPGDSENNEYDLLAPYWKQVREKLFPVLEQDTTSHWTQIENVTGAGVALPNVPSAQVPDGHPLLKTIPTLTGG